MPVLDEVGDRQGGVVGVDLGDLVCEREWCVRVLTIDHVEGGETR